MSQTNPLSDIISDEQYKRLVEEDIMAFTGVRNYLMRKRYKELRAKSLRSEASLLIVQQEIAPHLQIDTVRKTVCSTVDRLRSSTNMALVEQ